MEVFKIFNNLIEMLIDRGEDFPDKNVFTFLSYENGIAKEKNISYSDVINKAKEIAVYLSKAGVEKGDRIIIISTQTYDNIYSIFGAIFSGAIFTLIPPPIDRQKQERMRSVLLSSGAKFILCNEYLYEMLKDTAYKSYLINISDISEDPIQYILKDISIEDIAYLQYSSGSTNIPKAVVIKNKNVLSNINSLSEYFGNELLNSLVGWVPFYHNLGIVGLVLFSIYKNIRTVIIPTNEFLANPIRWFKAISDYSADITVAPNSAYRLCTRVIKETNLENIKLDSLRYAVNGSEPISFETLTDFSKTFGSFGFMAESFCPGYGLAESTCFVSGIKRNPFHISIEKSDLKSRNQLERINSNQTIKSVTSLGKIMNGIKCVVVNPETLKECKESEIGEICIQSDSVADGYWNMDEETVKTFKTTIDNHSGHFLRTGDMGYK